MMTQPESGTRRIRATIIGLSLDQDGSRRIITGQQCLVVGGSEETQGEMLETLLRLETELERRGRDLGDVSPAELVDIAWRIDSPELQEIALNMHAGLVRRGRSFQEATAEELTELATGWEP